MKLFIISVNEYDWDRSESIAILAETKERAIELAIEHDSIYKDNIFDVEEDDMTTEGVILDAIHHG